MYSFHRKTGGPPSVNIWPGFVDALSALLMVVIFVLMVFMVSQFYLSNLLSGREEMVSRLNRDLAEITRLLDLERSENVELRGRFAQLSADLQRTSRQRDGLRDQLADLESERDSLAVRLERALARADALEGEQADLSAELADAYTTIEADRETLELRLREIASLQADLQALRDARQDLEVQIASLSLALQAAQREADRLGIDLDETVSLAALLRVSLEDAEAARTVAESERDRLAEALAAEQDEIAELTGRLRLRDAEILEIRELLARSEELREALSERLARTETDQQDLVAALDQAEADAGRLTVELRLSEEDRDRLLAELGALRDRSQALEAELSSAEERTMLAQREIDTRDIRIEELLVALGVTEEALSAERELVAESRALIALLNEEIFSLREQLTRVEAALQASEQAVDLRDIEIANLNARLNQALIRQVEELRRYRSEFFGRLREVIGDRDDIQIVGDRFIFQSEVLFPSGSATLQAGGRAQLAQFAETLLEIAANVPDEVDWILRVDGHTDRRPIATATFPSNWELSTARALSVVRHLNELGVPEERMAAAGFGEHQPLDPADTEDAYQRNRRIELKLDQR